ncbi:hypothetical protein BBJ28_00026800, partial [Nothophytophthora sp. Chile5]
KAWDKRRERTKLENNIKLKAEEAPKIREQYDLVCTNWEERTKSLAAAKAKLEVDPNDAAAKKSVTEFTELLKSIGKDKDALEAKLTLYELLEATADAPLFLTGVNTRAKKETTMRTKLNKLSVQAAGVLTARSNDFIKAGEEAEKAVGKEAKKAGEEAKKKALKAFEMATAAHEKADNDAKKQINVATAMLAQQSQTKANVDGMIKLASTVLEHLDAESIDAESIDADFVGVCADAKRDFVAFRKQVEPSDAESGDAESGDSES